MKLKSGLLFLLFLGCFVTSYATHYRAGEILYELIGPYKYRVTVITYTKTSGISIQADRPAIIITWGDGTTDTVLRSNGPLVGGIPYGDTVLPDVKKNEYTGVHQYPGAPPAPNNFYVLQFFDENRLGGIANLAANQQNGSEGVTFFVDDTLFYYDPNVIGPSSSPVLVNPAVQYANVCDTFYTNPEAVDSNGDSLIYELVPCLADANDVVPQYFFPDQFCNQTGRQECVGANNSCTINRYTGDFVWAEPCEQGFYNVGILIHIYHHGLCIGTMLRDMQIIVRTDINDPPKLTIPDDTCVWAGDKLIEYVTATDPDAGQRVMISADGDPFHVPSPAVFDSVIGTVPPAVRDTFTWQTQCSHIQPQPYKVYFRAEDNFSAPGPDGVDPYHLNDIKTWRIYVVPPPVQGLTATATHSSVVLNWQNPYTCAGDENFRGFTVWRKVGCDSTDFDHCHTGLAGSGYVKLTANNISAYTYTDNTVIPGQAYSYRVLAEFYKLPPNGVITLQYDNQESVPSEKVCVNAPVSLPVILNADVMQTDAVNGQIYVRWAKPLAGGVNLDTVQDAPPYRFDLYHGDGFNLNNPALINSVTYNAYYLIPDTVSFIDNALNTQDGPWSYQVKFYANNNGPVVDTVGNSEIASSIYLSIHPSDQSLGLNWSYNVPWSNDSFTVFKRVNSTGIFDSIGVAYTSVYTDTSLINDTSYCYYVKGWGHYTSGLFPQPLINRSQKQCAVPIDTTAPCPPTLVVTNDCDQYNGQPWTAAQYVNHLKWTNNPDSCSADIVHYHIYYNPTDSGGFSLIDSLTSRDDTTYDHVLNDNLAGCYAVTAIDRAGNESRLSNIVCIDDCPYYVLPNAFTPNGDGANDKFHPFLPYRFVPKIEMKIYNRWGELMFETTDPMINWDGTDKSGNKVGDGVYLYAGYYYEQHLNGLVKKPLGNGKKGGGYIHLIRGK